MSSERTIGVRFTSKGIDRMMERSFEDGLNASRTANGSVAQCPYDDQLAPNLRGAWIYGFLTGKAQQPCRRTLRLI
jgi:hypothetical protein